MGSEPTITKLISQIETQFGKGAIMCLDGDNLITDIDCISSGSRLIDQALGVGGYPRGRIIEIYGPESSGKTTLCLHAIAEAQRVGGIAAFIDAEHAFDPSYAANLKVDVNELLLSQPDSGEQALQIAEALTRSGVVDLVVVDSVAALTPRAELEGQMGDTHVGLQARLMSQALRKLTAIVSKTDTTVIFINQLRHKIGVMFGSPETTPGGNALKFYSSVRMDVRRIGQLKSNQGAYGSRTRVKVVKNKLAPPFQIAEFDIRWGEGIDRLSEMIDEAREAGIITKRGAYLYLDSETLGQGKEKARLALRTNDALYQTLCDALDADAAPTSEPQPKEKEAPAAAA